MAEQLQQQANLVIPTSSDHQNGRDEGTVAKEGHPDFRPMDHSQLNAHYGEHYHVNGHYDDEGSYLHTIPIPPAFLPGGPKSLPGISMRAFCLGIALGLTSSLSLFLMTRTDLWRALAFLSFLSLFHFLEFWTTARYNTSQADTSAYLLTSNGAAYSVAHTTAMLEFLISHYFDLSFVNVLMPQRYKYVPLVLGTLLLLVGQTCRSLAMVQAGTNFNHHIQTKRARNHELVTDRIYAWLRHPSYFGFFWWGLGTQLLLGNIVCLAGYTLVLWRFFKGRIRGMCAPF